MSFPFMLSTIQVKSGLPPRMQSNDNLVAQMSISCCRHFAMVNNELIWFGKIITSIIIMVARQRYETLDWSPPVTILAKVM